MERMGAWISVISSQINMGDMGYIVDIDERVKFGIYCLSFEMSLHDQRDLLLRNQPDTSMNRETGAALWLL